MKILAFYKRFVSPFLPPACRFYPTCSEYAALCFRFDNPAIALFKSFARILKCNQLFKGGIAYPKIKVDFSHSIFWQRQCHRDKIAFYFVPCDKQKFYIIKSLKG
ncbi:membrane protein insertion efficiency factor YidD [Helicobacter sp. 23-1045]